MMRCAPSPLVFLLTVAAAAASPAPVTTWFDAATALELMDARRQFDMAELKAIAAFDRVIGGELRPVTMPVQQYRDQVASPALREIRWSQEQQKRSAAAMPARQAAVDAAERRLQMRTLGALKRFFAQERAAGRMTPAAYERVAGGELRDNYFPSIRRRKWTGPAVTGFRQEIKTAEYRRVLAEVRKLWAADAAGGGVVSAPGSQPAW
jgi:hypothetical protein